jgi:predicted GTPase
VYFRGRPDYRVVAFTATQIPDLEGRYSPELAGPLHPEGIPICAEDQLPALITRFRADHVVFANSDVSHEQRMHAGSIALAAAIFLLLGPGAMSQSARAGRQRLCCAAERGKSQTTRRVGGILRAWVGALQ